MSGSNESLHLGIDATGARSGADQFTAALNKIAAGVNALDQRTDVVFKNIKNRLSGLNFSQVAKDISSLGTTRVDASLATNLQRIATASASLRGTVTGTTTRELSNFARAMSTMRAPTDMGRLTTFFQTLRGFRGPTAAQVQNLRDLTTTINGMRFNTQNIQSIVDSLDKVTQAAHRASQALAGVRIPAGLGRFANYSPRPGGSSGGGGGGAGGRGGSYGPRSSVLSGPYDGIFSGSNRATGELRGLENIANPSFQAASVLRTMIPALTTGEMFRSLYDEGAKLTQFQHVLEVATTVPGDAIASQQALSQAMQFGSDTAVKYGVSLDAARDGFAHFAVSMKMARFDMSETQTTFEAVTSAFTAMRTPVEKQEQVWRGLSTVLAQNNLSMIQLHRQFDTALPGFQDVVAAVAFKSKNNMSQDTQLSMEQLKQAQAMLTDLTKHSQVKPELVLESFRQYAKQTQAGLATSLNSPMAALERFRSEWKITEDMMLKNGVWDEMGKQLNRLTDMFRTNDMQELFKRLANGIADALRLMGDAAEWASKHIDLVVFALKTLVTLGAIEMVLRLGGAFTNVANMARAAGAAIGFVASETLILSGRAMGISKIATAATAARASFAGLGATVGTIASSINPVGAAVIIAAAAMATAGGAAYFVLSQNWNELSKIGDKSFTIGEKASELMSMMRESISGAVESIGSRMGALWDELKSQISGIGIFGDKTFADMALSIAQTLGLIRSDAGSWSDAIIQAMAGIGAAAVNVGVVIKAAIMMIVDAARVGIALLASPITQTMKLLGKDPGPTFDLTPHLPEVEFTTSDKILAGMDKRLRDRRDAQNGNKGLPTPPPFIPPTSGAEHEMIGDGKGGKKKKDTTESKLDELEKSLNPAIAEIEKFLDSKKILDDALSKGIISKSAQMEGLSASQAYARDLQALKDKLLDAAGAFTPYTKALRETARAEQTMTGLVKLGIMSDQDKTNALKRVAESHRATLDPIGAEVAKMQEENSLLMMTNKQRQIQAEIMKVTDAARKSGYLAPDQNLSQQEQDSLTKLVTIHQQLEKYSKDQDVGLQAWANSFSNLYTELGKVEERLGGDLTDAMTKFMESPKDFKKNGGFGSMFKEMQGQLDHALVQQGLRSVSQVIGLTGPEGTDPTGSVFGGLLKSITGVDVAGALGHKAPKTGNDIIASQMKDNNGSLPVIVKNAHEIMGGSDSLSGGGSDSGGGGGGSSGGGSASGSGGGGSSSTSPLGKLIGGPGGVPGGITGGLNGLLTGNQKAAPGSAMEAFQKSGLIGLLQHSMGGGTTTGADGMPIENNGLIGSVMNWLHPPAAGTWGGGLTTGDMSSGADLVSQSNPAFQAIDEGAWDTAGQTGVFDASAAAANAAADTGISAASDAVADAGASAAADSISSSLSSIFSVFSEGGYSDSPVTRALVPAHKWSASSMPHYDEGTHNTSGGMPAMLHPNEAVIPLSRGRKIPVELPNASESNSGSKTPIQVHMHINTPDANSFRASQSQVQSSTGVAVMRAVSRNGR